MGLFDGYFDPNTYSGEGGGLLGRLLPEIQAGGYTPPPSPPFDGTASAMPVPFLSASMPLTASSAPVPFVGAPTAPSVPQTPDYGQTQNIAIGNYQMPQFGSADVSQTASAAPPQQPNLADRLSSGFQSWAHTPLGNPIAGLANGIQGFSTGQRADLTGNTQPDVISQFQQLRPLLGDRNAMIAVVHPEMGQTLIAQALAKQQNSGNADGANASGNGQSAPVNAGGPPPLAPLAPPASRPARYAAPAANTIARGNNPAATPRKPKANSPWSAPYGQ